MKKSIHQNYIYAALVAEGFLVMAIELLTQKSLEPFFGNTLYIWASVLSLTLFFITCGYYMGGRISVSNANRKTLFRLFFLAAIGTALIPVFVAFSLPVLERQDNLYFSSIFITSLCLALPLTSLASIPPLVIRLFTEKTQQAGQTTGLVFALSALAGVFGTLITGFLIIPFLGVNLPLIIISIILIILGLFFAENKKMALIAAFSILLIGGLINFNISEESNREKRNIVFKEDGLMGKIAVYDRQAGADGKFHRMLMVNNIVQSVIQGGDNSATSLYKYVHTVAALSSTLQKNSKILTCGLAGGSLVSEFSRMGFTDLDVVDIDPRMYEVAKEYFYLNESKLNFISDDARHYLMATDKKYDMIIIDISAAESQPTYLYSVECLKRVREVLTPNGFLVINFQSPVNENRSNPGNLVYQTIHHSGLSPRIITGEETGYDDIIYLGFKNSKTSEKLIDINRVNSCCLLVPHVKKLVNQENIKTLAILNPPVFLKDDLPVLEIIKAEELTKQRMRNLKEFSY